MFYPTCGSPLQEGAQFCGNCGASVGTAPAPAAPVQAVPPQPRKPSPNVKLCPRRQLIKVNQALNKNQVFAAPEDYGFVANFILAHVPPQIKVKQ